MGSGYYAASSHPPDMDTRSEDSITREIIADITVGVADTGVRSGIVGEIGCSWPWTANEQKVLRAAAEAAKVTGAVLTIHPGRDAAAPQIHLKMIRQTGLGFDRVVMCHVERTVDTADGLKELAETGCYLEYDLFGIEISHYPMSAFELPSDAERMRQIMGLIDGGYLERVLISHDIAFKVRLVRYGGHGYAHILRHIVPRLRKRGLGDKEIRTLLVDNPARAITIA
jgi:phosphotriesterase-related protein